jgi:hypothetical protein
MGEGEFYLPQYTPWHQVPYHIMIPMGFDNLFTPTAVSATHVAYGTYRMEPVRMHFGAAAGIAAHLCARYALTPRDVPVRQIQLELLKSRPGTEKSPAMDGFGAPGPSPIPAYLYLFSDVGAETPKYRAVQWLAARGFWPSPEAVPSNSNTVVSAQPFDPGGPVTASELARLTPILIERWGRPKTRIVLAGRDDSVISRGNAALWLFSYLGWPPGGREPYGTYEDIPRSHALYEAVEALKERWIDSRLWDGPKAFAPADKLYFRPEQPITRAQLAELLWLADMHFGPLWHDHPGDTGPIPVSR